MWPPKSPRVSNSFHCSNTPDHLSNIGIPVTTVLATLLLSVVFTKVSTFTTAFFQI